MQNFLDRRSVPYNVREWGGGGGQLYFGESVTSASRLPCLKPSFKLTFLNYNCEKGPVFGENLRHL